ncbi:hypothetical protein V8F20_005336 [Naviculisporaceae sp. PSN 640]
MQFPVTLTSLFGLASLATAQCPECLPTPIYNIDGAHYEIYAGHELWTPDWLQQIPNSDVLSCARACHEWNVNNNGTCFAGSLDLTTQTCFLKKQNYTRKINTVNVITVVGYGK